MTKTELESKRLSELHELAAEAGIEGYRMLPKPELVEKLASGGSGAGPKPQRPREGGRRRERGGGEKARQPRGSRERRDPRGPRDGSQREPEREPTPQRREQPAAPETAPATPTAGERPKRKRRRRWGRRRKGVRVHDLLLPATPGRQAIVYGESRQACTALLREVAAELSGASNGPDPIALLVDPSPEELAEWRRDAPQAEIVAAGQARHADDALAQAKTRAGAGEDVIVLIDSLSRFAESFAGPDEARDLLDAGLTSTGSGSLTVVAAVERPS
jgi:transcription termination factor Rho